MSIPLNPYVVHAIFNASTDALTLEDVDEAVEYMTDEEVEEFMLLLRHLGVMADCSYIMKTPANELPL